MEGFLRKDVYGRVFVEGCSRKRVHGRMMRGWRGEKA